MSITEPIHTMRSRTTATSKSEGRLRSNLGSRRFGRPRTNAERRRRHKSIYGTLDNMPAQRQYLRRRLSSYV